MNKTILKILSCFIFSAVLITMILLIINFVAFAITMSDSENLYEKSPNKILDDIAVSLAKSETGLKNNLPIPQDTWCILIDASGGVVWSQNMPDDIPSQYTINDIAVMAKWYLNDYPVYMRTIEEGLLVFGYPKKSVGKYSIVYSMNWFDTLPQRISIVLLINICLASILALLVGLGLYRNLKALLRGIQELRLERPVRLREKGLFKELAKNINRTSDAIERKNDLLKTRDSARSNWIAGISHDIRTPLSIIVGYAEELGDNANLSGEDKKKTGIITAQSLKIKKLVDDLNLISSLEYDMQPSKKKNIKICSLLRHVVSDLLNSGVPKSVTIDLDLRYEKAVVTGDEALLERAVFNLLNNSITHNKDGCKIKITQDYDKATSRVLLELSDNGCGVAKEVLDRMDKLPKSAHGLGLPMAYRIVAVHGGKLSAKNGHGFHVRIELPCDC